MRAAVVMVSLLSEGWEVHSEQVGPWREWYDNGQLARQVVRLPDDGQTGTYGQWNRDGKLLGRTGVTCRKHRLRRAAGARLRPRPAP